MIYILISICCSVTVAVLLKLSKRYQISIVQTVTWNYLFAITLASLVFKPAMTEVLQAPSKLHVALGVLLPVVFWFLAASIKHLGIVKTDIAQRLSLFIPVAAAFFLFSEQISLFKFVGLATALIAITLILKRREKASSQRSNWIYTLVVFFGFGIIDILFKQLAQHRLVPYTTSLITVFCVAFIISLSYILLLAFRRKEKLSAINFICGCVLGLFNFGNIYFYLKAHQTLPDNPSTVFATMNMGVIILGSLAGIFLFRERLSRINYIGLALALVAIIFITISQTYAI